MAHQIEIENVNERVSICAYLSIPLEYSCDNRNLSLLTQIFINYESKLHDMDSVGHKHKGLFSFIRKTSFLTFFLSWIVSIFIFAFIYWAISLLTSGLVLEGEQILFNVSGLFRSIYASFLIATIFGMIKIDYEGILVFFIYLQLFFSIAIILILVDKLLQKYILPYHHNNNSLDKKVNTMMLMMSIFRNDIDKMKYEFKAKTSHNIKIKDIEAIIDGLYVVFLDIEKLFSVKSIHKNKIKDIQYLMLTANIEDSLEKLSEFIEFLDKHKIEWKDKSVEFWLRYILETADKITMNVDTSKINNPRVIIAIENIKEYTQKIEEKL